MCLAIAKMTEGFSFAYLKELFITSLLIVARGSTSEDTVEPALSDHSSTVDTVVVEDPTEDIETETIPVRIEEGNKNKASLKPKTKRIIPKIEVSRDLQNNVLLAVITAQAQALLNEMDNTEGELELKSKVTGAGGDGEDDF